MYTHVVTHCQSHRIGTSIQDSVTYVHSEGDCASSHYVQIGDEEEDFVVGERSREGLVIEVVRKVNLTRTEINNLGVTGQRA